MSHFSGAVALTRNLNTLGVISVFRAKETDMSGQGLLMSSRFGLFNELCKSWAEPPLPQLV